MCHGFHIVVSTCHLHHTVDFWTCLVHDTTTPAQSYMLLRRHTMVYTTLLYPWLLLPLLVATALVSGFVSVKHPSNSLKRLPSFAPCTALSAAAASSSSTYKPHVPNFCSNCGSANMKLEVPEGDDHLRPVCQDCRAVVYANPKIVVACVVMVQTSSSSTATTASHQQNQNQTKVLLAKRAIEPRAGYWGIPQGFMELDDKTSRTATCREVLEETGAVISPDHLRLRALYNVPGSVQLVYSVTVASENELMNIAETTTESSDIGLFALDSLPDLCFPTVQWALDHCCGGSGDKSNSIQQKNKLYNAESGKWSESDDRDGP